jgi:hypothetical protein
MIVEIEELAVNVTIVRNEAQGYNRIFGQA